MLRLPPISTRTASLVPYTTLFRSVLPIRAIFRALADPTDPCPIRTLVVFAALSYWFWCAAFSGDVNDNRPLWAMIGMALAAQAGWRQVGPAVSATMAKVPEAAQSIRAPKTVQIGRASCRESVCK